MFTSPLHTQAAAYRRCCYWSSCVYLHQVLEKWLNHHSDKTLRVFQISKIFCEGYSKACTPTNEINGFVKNGIYPFDPEVFSDVDFLAAEVIHQIPSDFDKSEDNIPTTCTSPKLQEGQPFPEIQCKRNTPKKSCGSAVLTSMHTKLLLKRISTKKKTMKRKIGRKIVNVEEQYNKIPYSPEKNCFVNLP